LEARFKQAGAASYIREDGRESSGGRICRLSANDPQASHLHPEDLWTGEAGIILGSVTKKDVTYFSRNTLYLSHPTGYTPRGEGLARVAGQSCRAGPAVAPAAPRLRAPPCMGLW